MVRHRIELVTLVGIMLLGGCGGSSNNSTPFDGSPDGQGGQRQDGGSLDGGQKQDVNRLESGAPDLASLTPDGGVSEPDAGGGTNPNQDGGAVAQDSGIANQDLGGATYPDDASVDAPSPSDGGAEFLADAGLNRDLGQPVPDSQPAPDSGSVINPNQDGGAADGSVGSLLSVVSTDPADGATGVPLNKSLRIVFDHLIAADSNTGKISVSDSSGNKVAGQFVVMGSVVEFLPGRYKASEVHTLIIDGAFGLKDGKTKTITFTTGTTNLDGTVPPPDDISPFGRKNEAVTLSPQAEIGLVWTRREYNASNWDHTDYAGNDYLALEDPPFNPAPLTNPGSPNSSNKVWKEIPSLGAYENEPFVGQFDKDFYQEIAVVSRASDGTLKLTIQDTTDTGTSSSISTDLTFAAADSFAAATGDFDNDRRDELLLVTSKSGENPRWYVIKWDEASNTYKTKTQDTLPISTYEYVRVAAGDMDGDGKAEAAFVWHVAPTGGGSNPSTIKYSVYSNLLGATRTVQVDSRTIANDVAGRWGDDWRPTVDVVAADLDGDGAAELAFGLDEFLFQWNNSANSYRCIVIQQRLYVADHYAAPVLIGKTGGSETYQPERSVYRPHLSAGGAMAGKEGYMVGSGWGKWGKETVHRPLSGLVAGRLSGDKIRSELMFFNRMFQFKRSSSIVPSGASSTALEDNWPKVLPQRVMNLEGAEAGAGLNARDPIDMFDAFYTRDIKVANILGSDKEQVVFLRQSSGQSDRNGSFKKGFFVTTLDLDLDKANDAMFISKDVAFESSYANNYAGLSGNPRLALANVDNDSYAVTFTEHSVVLADPQIVALLVAPPNNQSISQNADSCSTTFSEGSGTTVTKGTTMNWGAYVGMGFELEASEGGGLFAVATIKVSSLEVSARAGYKGSYNWEWTTTTSETFDYSAGANSNLVVFDSPVFDRYTHTIVSHPNPASVGKKMNIDVPSGKKRLAVSQEYFNRSVPEKFRLGTSVVSSVPGDPKSYLTRVQANTLLTGGNVGLVIAPPGKTIRPAEGLSNGASYTFARSEAFANGSTHGFEIGVDTKVCATVVCASFGVNWGMDFSYMYEVSKDVSFTLALGGIATADFARYVYDTGLFAYTYKMPGQEFVVVNYFVE